jgi:hypothetical protein
MKRIWKDYGLSITLGALFVACWVGHLLVQIPEFRQEQAELGQPFEWQDFWITFGRSTLENWQSEFLQLLAFVVLSSLLSHKGSPESRDSEEKTERKLDEILRRLKHVEERGPPA